MSQNEITKGRRMITGIQFQDSFLSPVLASDWLIFCCRSLIFCQKKKKKRNENDENANFTKKNNSNKSDVTHP